MQICPRQTIKSKYILKKHIKNIKWTFNKILLKQIIETFKIKKKNITKIFEKSKYYILNHFI